MVHRVRRPRLALLAACFVALVAPSSPAAAAAVPCTGRHGVGAWAASPSNSGAAYASPAGSGDHVSEPGGDGFGDELRTWPYLSDVEVRTSNRAGAVLAVGDSITDGANSTPDTNRRWPDLLARRLAAAGRPLAVQNAGISGNRILRDSTPAAGPGTPRLFGPSLLQRLGRDVLDQPGATDALVLEGTNDLADASPEAPAAGAQQVIAGLRAVVRRLRAAGIRPILATQTPAGGSPTHGAPQAVAVRDAVNRWIRGSGIPFVDFDAATRDPADRDRFLAACDSGDHLHPNDAGMRAMVRAIRLSVLRGPDCAG